MGLATGPTWRVMEAGVAGPSRAGAAALLELEKKGRGGGRGCLWGVSWKPGARWSLGRGEIRAGGHGDLEARQMLACPEAMTQSTSSIYVRRGQHVTRLQGQEPASGETGRLRSFPRRYMWGVNPAPQVCGPGGWRGWGSTPRHSAHLDLPGASRPDLAAAGGAAEERAARPQPATGPAGPAPSAGE